MREGLTPSSRDLGAHILGMSASRTAVATAATQQGAEYL
jgi:hypothetical protein